jgi:thymidylate synthase
MHTVTRKLSFSYRLLCVTYYDAQVCDLEAGEFPYFWGCTYLQQSYGTTKVAIVQRTKTITKMILNPNIKDIFQFDFDDFTLEGYEPHPLIKGNVSV